MKFNGKGKFHLIKPSTQNFIREAKAAQDYTFFDLLHGYVYARWLYLYIGLGLGEHPLAKKWGPVVKRLWLKRNEDEYPADGLAAPGDGEAARESKGFAEGYHGKVVPLDSARKLVLVKEEIRLPDLEQVIPYDRARALILKNPDHIAVLDCPCRSARSNPCLPLDVCLVVGEPFASLVVERHPERARRITQAEAANILEEEDRRGHVHHAFFKDAMLGRFYAICNCCACCCGAMQSQRNGTPMLASSGYVCQVEAELCIGCGGCAGACQFGAIQVVDFASQVDEAACMGCGVCVNQCEQGALMLRREESRGVPLEICMLVGK